MITLYRKPDCPRCGHIQETLEDLQIAHEVVTLDGSGELPDDVDAEKLPVLVDEGQAYVGADEIVKRLEYLERFRELWYKYQSDACYCDEDEEIELE
jgi:glutaredoxin